MAEGNFSKAWAKIVAKTWSDESFKQKLLKDPVKVCKENGLEFPKDANVKITENTEKNIHLVIPAKPSGEISEETLQKIAAGACANICNL